MAAVDNAQEQSSWCACERAFGARFPLTGDTTEGRALQGVVAGSGPGEFATLCCV